MSDHTIVDAGSSYVIIAPKKQKDPQQLDLFANDYENWCMHARATLASMPDHFSWDDFRKRLPYQPANGNWLGQFSRWMQKHGYRRVEPQVSDRESRKGGWIWMWERIREEQP